MDHTTVFESPTRATEAVRELIWRTDDLRAELLLLHGECVASGEDPATYVSDYVYAVVNPDENNMTADDPGVHLAIALMDIAFGLIDWSEVIDWLLRLDKGE